MDNFIYPQKEINFINYYFYFAALAVASNILVTHSVPLFSIYKQEKSVMKWIII